MSYSVNTGDRYHAQDTNYYCGAACAMMVLVEIGVPYSKLDQDDLYNSNHSHNARSGWYTDPYGLCYTLNNRRPTSFLPKYFVVNKRPNEADATRDVAFTLYHYKVSPAVLVYNGAHWNVVRGVQTDVDPSTGPYTVKGFWLNNPVWDASVSHHGATDTCGSGGSHGVANEFVTYAEWRTNRFNGCAYDDPSGSTQWISVCDPEPATIDLPRERAQRLRAAGRQLIAPNQVAKFAAAGLSEYGLKDSELGAEALSGGNLGQPLLVQRLDRPGDFYYLAPWQRGGRTTAFIDIDARFGAFKSMRVISTPTRNRAVPKSPTRGARDSLARRLDNRVFDLPGEQGRLRVRPGTYCVPPVLSWKPCRESWSPSLPFYHIVVGGHSLYLRIDGAVFTELTTGCGA
jgi:hypothetical protein